MSFLAATETCIVIPRNAYFNNVVSCFDLSCEIVVHWLLYMTVLLYSILYYTAVQFCAMGG